MIKERHKHYIKILIIYTIVIAILIRTLPYTSRYFDNAVPCVSDFFLFFYDFPNNIFLCNLELVVAAFMIISIIRYEMSDFRVVLYSSMSKLWLNCVKKCAWISIVFPLINSGCALSYPSVINCNWLEEGSVARNFIPNGNITTENTFVIILICFLLDILRVQITILTICALHWIIRNPVADFIITYACIFTTYVSVLPFENFYRKMCLNQSDVYISGIYYADDVITPFIIWIDMILISWAVIKFYRKDMLKN
jgi:hypothetical protein